MSLTNSSSIEIAAMRRVATKHIKKGMVVGLGSGSTVSEFVRAVACLPKSMLATVRFIPSSLQIRSVAELAGLTLLSEPLTDSLDVVVDGADQIDHKGVMIKGGGGALFREKILLSIGKNNIILADKNKYVEYLSRPIPVEVHPFARLVVRHKLEKIGGRPRLRTNERGYPTISENGNLLYDVDFGTIEQPSKLGESLRNIQGIIENGIFVCKVDTFYKNTESGKVITFKPEKA
jgi:ribose 5-phosphate isomerase A